MPSTPPPSDALPSMLTAEQAAELLQASTAQVTRWARTGEIPGVRLAGEWRFSRAQLLAFLSDNSQ